MVRGAWLQPAAQALLDEVERRLAAGEPSTLVYQQAAARASELFGTRVLPYHVRNALYRLRRGGSSRRRRMSLVDVLAEIVSQELSEAIQERDRRIQELTEQVRRLQSQLSHRTSEQELLERRLTEALRRKGLLGEEPVRRAG